jgi:hypothetical protein
VRSGIGAKIEDSFTEALKSIYQATYSRGTQKIERITKAQEHLDLIKFFLYIAWELKIIENKKFILLNEKLIACGKMLNGWIYSIEQKLPR